MRARAPVEIAPGTEVRGFVLEAKLGAGGFATVYRARRGERRYALKFIRTAVAGRWAQREVDVLQRLSHPNVVGFEGCGFWPDDTHEYSVVIMDYVEGRRLDEWAQEENPDARQVAHKVLGVGRALAALHQQQVVHRDVKEPNILVRASDGEAVLVDFGVAGGEQLRRVTRDLMPPCTPEYRAPEAWRWFRANARAGQGHYEPGPGDDVYALGVVLYWLLTGRLPCEGATLEEQVEATLHQVPVAPRELNPRVPVALSALCMRMLEKQPEQRYADGAAVCAAVEEALARADAEWELPLCEGYDADKATTQSELAKAGDDDGVDRALRKARHAYERPRRGRRPAALPPAEPPAPPLAPPEVAAGSRGAAVVVKGAPTPGGRTRWSVALRVAVGLGLAVAVGEIWLGPHLPRGSAPPAATELPGSMPPHEARAALPEPTWEIGWKVAPPWKPPEAVAPELFGTEGVAEEAPSPVRERGVAFVKKPQKKKILGEVSRAASTATACITLACTASQVRPMPPAEECPAGAVETMRALGMLDNEHGGVRWQDSAVGSPDVTVKEGWTTGWQANHSLRLPLDTVLSGKLFFCGERVCIRFTQVRLAKEGRTVPVCLEAWEHNVEKRGLPREPGSTEDNVKVSWTMRTKAVERFE